MYTVTRLYPIYSILSNGPNKYCIVIIKLRAIQLYCFLFKVIHVCKSTSSVENHTEKNIVSGEHWCMHTYVHAITHLGMLLHIWTRAQII